MASGLIDADLGVAAPPTWSPLNSDRTVPGCWELGKGARAGCSLSAQPFYVSFIKTEGPEKGGTIELLGLGSFSTFYLFYMYKYRHACLEVGGQSEVIGSLSIM